MSVFARQTNRFVKLKNVGDQVSGTVVEVSEPRQATKYDPRPGAPRVLDFWEAKDGGAPRPKMEVILTLQTDLNDGPDESGVADDGQRKVVVPVFYKEGSALFEIQKAIVNAGGSDIEPGAWIGLRHSGHDPESANPDNPRKLYQAAYKRPAGGGGAFAAGAGQQEQPPAAPQQQAYQQPAAAFTQQAEQAGFYQQPAAAPQPAAWQPPQQVNTGTGELGGGAPATDPWGAPVNQQAAQTWQPPAEPPRDPAMYQQPANPTPQQQQAAQQFNGGQSNQAWQPPAQQPAAAPPVVQVDAAAVRALIQQGAPDGYIMEQTGASLEAVTAIRNI